MAAKYGETPSSEDDVNGQGASHDGSEAEAAWQRLFEKMNHNAVLSNNDYDAIFSLVRSRNEGLAIDDGRLWELHQILCRRDAPPAVLYVRFGYYAALTLDDMTRATSAFKRALELLADKPNEQAALKQAISAAGLELDPDVTACQSIDDAIDTGPEAEAG
jgi:hypothetical protein